MSESPVVTGLGAITPLGLSVPESWEGLVAGRVRCVRAHREFLGIQQRLEYGTGRGDYYG